jgi:capsular exopolysaccharide synthesis family protein
MATHSPALADSDISRPQNGRTARSRHAVGIGSADHPTRQFPRDEVDERLTALLRGLPWPGANAVEALKTLALTGCRGGEGVSTVASRLAVRAAELSAGHVLLVDANLARPSLAREFDVPSAPGLADVLLGRYELSVATRQTEVSRLSVVPAGDDALPLDEVGDPSRLAGLVAEIKNKFALAIFDLPPAGEVVSAACLAGLLDGVVLVVAADRTRWEAGQRVSRQLARFNARLLGAVLNGRRRRTMSWLGSDA